MTTTYLVRLLGGRTVAVTYDGTGQTLSIAGQSLSISSLQTALQTQLQTALATVSPLGLGATLPAFAGDNLQAAIGNILDATPLWRSAVASVLATANL